VTAPDAALTIYLDECVDHDVIPHLEHRGHRVRTAQGEGTSADDDEAQVRHATRQGWVMITTNRRHFQSLHRRLQARGESHSGIIALPQDDSRPDRFFLRCALLAAWIMDAFDAPHDRLFRWTDLQLELQRGYVVPGFSADEIALALGGEGDQSLI
jgi:hypothetical protein